MQPLPANPLLASPGRHFSLTDDSFGATTAKLVEVAGQYNKCRAAAGSNHETNHLLCALDPGSILSMAAAPSCLPSNVGGSGTAWVGNVNQAGMWVGWWCSRTEVYVAACTRSTCLGQWAAFRLDRALAAKPQHRRFGLWRRPPKVTRSCALMGTDLAMLDAVRPR